MHTEKYFNNWLEKKFQGRLLFYLFAISCQVVHSNSQEDVQQDVWTEVDVKDII